MPGFHDVVTLLANGQPVDAPTVNGPLAQLQDNALYLRDLFNASNLSTALFARGVTVATAVLVGSPVYYNPGTQQYELALADGSAKENVVGLCMAKTNPTLADIILLGYATLDISAAYGGAVTAGRYWLSTTVAGKLVTVQPSPSVLLCTADGLGHVFVMPQIRDLTGPAGPAGAAGATGATGATGPVSHPIPILLTTGGTSTDALVSVATGACTTGLVGCLSVSNTGANSLTVSLTMTDAFGTAATATAAVLPVAKWSVNLGGVIQPGCAPPYVSFTLSVKSTTVGNPTTYQVRGNMVN